MRTALHHVPVRSRPESVSHRQRGSKAQTPTSAHTPHLPPQWVMDQAPVFGQLRPRRPWSSAPHFGATLASDHFFRKNGLLTKVFHVFVMSCRFGFRPVQHRMCSWTRRVATRYQGKSGEDYYRNAHLQYDFGLALTWLDCEHHRLATVLECYTHPWEKGPGLRRPLAPGPL